MRFQIGISILSILLLTTLIPVAAEDIHMYIEKKDGFHRFGNEYFRFEEINEFLVGSYEFYEGYTKVNVTMYDDSNFGTFHTVTQDVNRVNIVMTPTFNENGSLLNIDWDMGLFRQPEDFGEPFNSQETQLLVRGDNRRFDLRLVNDTFTISLEYYEIQEIDGEEQRIRVNTELSVDNYLDGRIKRSAIHIIKRLSDDRIIYDFNWSIKEVDTATRYINYLDQPLLYAPVIMALVFLGVYIYTRTYRYITENDIKIVRGTPKQSDIGQDNQPEQDVKNDESTE